MALPTLSLAGKVVIVTGASRGIGRAIALSFAEAGADVVVASRTLPMLEKVAGEIRALGRCSLAVAADISIKSQVDNLVQKTVEHLGTIDILVNNAAINVMRSLMELREDGWDKVMNVGLKGYFLCSQAAAKVMIERKSGSIINMASAAAAKANPALGAYSISKAGVVMLTRVLAAELARHKIRVNAIGPSIVRTELSQPLWGNPAALKNIEAGIPLGRIAETGDIVGVALFLASDLAGYITGQTIYVDGGTMA